MSSRHYTRWFGARSVRQDGFFSPNKDFWNSPGNNEVSHLMIWDEIGSSGWIFVVRFWMRVHSCFWTNVAISGTMPKMSEKVSGIPVWAQSRDGMRDERGEYFKNCYHKVQLFGFLPSKLFPSAPTFRWTNVAFLNQKLFRGRKLPHFLCVTDLIAWMCVKTRFELVTPCWWVCQNCPKKVSGIPFLSSKRRWIKTG